MGKDFANRALRSRLSLSVFDLSKRPFKNKSVLESAGRHRQSSFTGRIERVFLHLLVIGFLHALVTSFVSIGCT